MKISRLLREAHVSLVGDVGYGLYRQVLKVYGYAIKERISKLSFFISSDGGCCATGASIIFLLRDLKKNGVEITMVGGGTVASAAMAIFMEGDKRYAMPESTYMTHKASIGSYKWALNENDLKDQLKAIEKKTILDDHLKMIRMTKKQRKDYDDGKDVNFSVNQALKNGILTGRLT